MGTNVAAASVGMTEEKELWSINSSRLRVEIYHGPRACATKLKFFLNAIGSHPANVSFREKNKVKQDLGLELSKFSFHPAALQEIWWCHARIASTAM